MADLAIGLSKKVVDGLVKKVESAIKEEQELWQIVGRDSVFIKDEFETMKSFLRTADRDRVRNSVVRTWVRQVRDLSYDAEDCIDGVLELEPKRPWWALPFLPRMLPTCCRPKPRVGRALDEAVDKINLIKSRVEEVSQRNLRYNNLINTTGSEQMQQAATAMDMDIDLAKVQEGSWRLMWLLDYKGRQRRVISVWGTGGNRGSISIIRNAFDNPKVCQWHKCRAWVKLMHPFSPQKFLGDLVVQLLTNSGATDDVWSKMEASSADLAKEVEQLVKGHPYLIVLENLSNMEEWYAIRTYLPDDENGSRVIVSTQDREMAKLCIGLGQQQHVQELSQVSADHCVYAFFKEIRIPSQQNQGSTYVASLSAAANYWYYYYLPSIIGRHEEKVRQLSVHISSSSSQRWWASNDTHVIIVLGPASNIGKDVVAKVCSQLLLNTNSRLSFELYGWVNVSNNPFNVRGFAQSLLSVLRPNLPENDSTDPVQECSRLLRGHRCLVVISGLQTQDCSELASAGLIYNNHPDGCILVITSEASVVTYWPNAAVCNIKPNAAACHPGQQGQVPTPRSMDDIISRLFYMANSSFPKYFSSTIIGRDKEVHRLSNMISLRGQNTSTTTTRVIVIWGPPGVGKTALVQKVYSQFVPSRPFVLCGWVEVSNPFDLMGFSRSLLSVLRPWSPESSHPIEECSNFVQNHACLVVVDGLQSMDNFWDLVNAGFIYGHRDSCILLITTEKSVTTCMASLVPETDDALFQVKPLDGLSASGLFTKVYEQERQYNYTSIDQVLLRNKCCGFPIVILAVAKYLGRASKDAVKKFMEAVNDGKFIHELSTNPEPEFVALKGLLSWVDSDFKACPESLKLLILYMLNFSEETVVRRKRLLRRWIAEGYIKNTGIRDMVTEAQERARELEDLRMIVMQMKTRGRQRGYQLISGFSGMVLLSRAVEDQLFFPLEISALAVLESPERSSSSLTSRACAGRHLRIDAKWERNEFVFRSLDLSRLRSLTVSGEFKAFFISDNMRVLRVLDLEDVSAGIEIDHLEKIPKVLPLLRFLSVRGCREIDRLPDSIGKLRLLQTLDIRRTKITTLPKSILKLQNLQCLRAGHTMQAQTTGDPYKPGSRLCGGLASCSWQTGTRRSYAAQGVIMPRGMSQLTALHTLGIVNVNTAGGEATLEELRHLKQLFKLELYGINSCNVRVLGHCLPHSLSSLSLGFTRGRDATSSSFQFSLSDDLLISRWGLPLKLHGHVGILQVLPDGIKVTDLTLEIDTSLTEDNMKRIGKLRRLCTLRLHFNDTRQEGDKLKFDANGGFRQLEDLEITSLDHARPLHVEFAKGTLEETLKVLRFVGSLKISPGGLHVLRSLKEVWVEGRTLRAEMIKILEGHPSKPAVIDSWGWHSLRLPEIVDPAEM